MTTIDDCRAEMLFEARSKLKSALRFARIGDVGEEKYWLRVAGRMTQWIEQLEYRSDTPGMPVRSGKIPELLVGQPGR